MLYFRMQYFDTNVINADGARVAWSLIVDAINARLPENVDNMIYVVDVNNMGLSNFSVSIIMALQEHIK